jgi:hypothetical protein
MPDRADAQPTFAHVVRFKAPMEQLLGIGMQGFRERVVPALRELPGLRGTLVLLDRAEGEQLGITLWDTEEHARAAAIRLEPEREIGVVEMGAASAPGNLYDVVVQTTGSLTEADST